MDQLDALIETAGRLWPGASLERTSDRGSRTLVAVPRARSARLLVPDDRRAAAEAMRRFSAATTWRETVERIAVSTLVRVVGPRFLPDGVRIEHGEDGIDSHVASVLGHPVTVSLGIGTVRANRKPVLGVFDRTGRLCAYVKVGDNPVATAHVSGEAESLRAIGGRTWRVLETPRLLDAAEWNGLFVLVMSAVRAPALQARRGRAFPEAAMHELATAFDEGTMPLADAPMWRRCEAVPGRIVDEEIAARLRRAIEQVHAAAGGRKVRVGAWHGDFTPWNMAHRGHRLQVWDWERFETGVPYGMDRVHYWLVLLAVEADFTPRRVRAALEVGAPELGDPSSEDAAVAMAYVLSLTCRYLLAAQDDGGDAIRGKAMTMLDVLETLPSVPAAGRR